MSLPYNIWLVLLPAVAATITSIYAIAVILIINNKGKLNSGLNEKTHKAAYAIGIALIALSILFIFYTAIVKSGAITALQSTPFSNLKIIAIAIASSLLSVFMFALLGRTLYSKYGKALLSFIELSEGDASENGTSEESFDANKASDEISLNDSLTKLPNRRSFELHLRSAESRCVRNKKAFAIAYIDLDSFKPVNDNFGHHIGDVVLRMVADRLTEALRGCDFVARVGGDEFIAIIEEIDSEEDTKPVAERIVSSIKEPYYVDHLNITLSCSVGIAIFPKDGRKEQLLVNADSAMYKAKDQGKNQYKFYDAEIESANVLIKSLQNDLRQAVQNNEFSIAYLPKLDCKTLTAVGAEALIRWNHPTKGEIQPNDFLSIAEQCGLIKEINDWVVSECCSTLVKARKADLDLHISVNLSSYQYRDPNLVGNIVRTIKDFDLHPNHLSFEIKETAAINNQAQFKFLLEMFKDAGIKVILDDFGLLPVSLTYLLELDIDEVKIDRSFIAMINKDKGAKALIDAIFQLTHALGFKVTAEGIEDNAQQNAIIALGCDYMQGYLFSKPIKEAELLVLYKKLQYKQLRIDFD